MNNPMQSPRSTPILTVCSVLASVLCVVLHSDAVANDAEIDFNRDIRPLLSDRCFHCHGPDQADRQAELRLDISDGDDGAYREAYGVVAVAPGSLERSEVWQRLISDDPDVVMPPPDSHKPPLDDDERARIRRWILNGATYDAFWSFVPPAEPDGLPYSTADAIDGLVNRKLAATGIQAEPAADRETLIRRLSLDLTGLPPTSDQSDAFVRDASPDAYRRAVDRLLASPHFGEHVARHWLDLVRFADTNGLHHDHYRDLSPYRDWVIRSFNANLPYDLFVRDQLAGDLLDEPTRDELIASGFHRLHLIIDRGTALPEESLQRNVLDRVTAAGTAFMGLTFQCAVCHDHKYDPITAKDFYAFSAFFNNIDAEPETGRRGTTDFYRGLQSPYIDLMSDAQSEIVDKLRAEVKHAEHRLKVASQPLPKFEPTADIVDSNTADEPTAPVDVSDDQDDPPTEIEDAAQRRQSEIKRARIERAEQVRKRDESIATQKRRLAGARKRLDDFMKSIPGAMVMRERATIRPTHIAIRGQYDQPGELVTRDTPGFLSPIRYEGEQPTRLDLANWLTNPHHPLTARVAVNRFWQSLFGTGLVRTSEDFGAQGEPPSHPDLLDTLAVRFVRSGWDVKSLYRDIVMSETYQRSSHSSAANFRSDPDNRLLARGSRYRLDAEVIRDQIFATSGLLNRRMFGKSVRPPQPDGLWTSVAMPYSYPRQFVADAGGPAYRRSVYTFWKRAMPPPQMSILNAPGREACLARRERTNTPLQALLLMNEPEYLRAAANLADTVVTTIDDDRERITELHRRVTARSIDANNLSRWVTLLNDLTRMYQSDPTSAAKLIRHSALADAPEGLSPARRAAWTMLTSTLYNLDATRNRE